MEELRSTEVLEREILEDARKKAAKLLKTADDTLAQKKRSWDRKLNDDLESIRKTYMARIKKNIEDIFARLPLDKRRLRLKTHEEFLSAATNTFLSSLGREKTLSILERELLRLLETAGFEAGAKTTAVVRYSNLALSEAREILAKSPAPFEWEFRETPGADGLAHNDLLSSSLLSQSAFPYIVIDTEKFRITASVEATAEALLNDSREELAAALLGREALYD